MVYDEELLKILICGSRIIKDYHFVRQWCDDIVSREQYERVIPNKLLEVISGNGTGADSLGERWAKERKLALRLFQPNWSNLNPSLETVVEAADSKGRRYNRLAGINRNSRMVEYISEYKPDAICVAFDLNESQGTKDTIKKAKKAGIKVYQIICKDISNVKVKVWN
jgi:YspA, cpYpsA-related SLOG family